MSYRSTQTKVALDKQEHPERYCPHPKCLWRTGGGRCPRHPAQEPAHDIRYCKACFGSEDFGRLRRPGDGCACDAGWLTRAEYDALRKAEGK